MKETYEEYPVYKVYREEGFDVPDVSHMSNYTGIFFYRFSSMTEEEANAMIASGEISQGMILKVNSAFDTLHRGVKKVHMVDGRVLHSLLVEIYTDSGIGTQFLLKR